MPVAVIVLAAGQGTRMNSDLPKVLHPLAGAPLIAHALAAARGVEPERMVLVTGHGGEAVAAAGAGDRPRSSGSSTQAEQLGTGHAVLQAAPELEGFDGDAIVLYGDTPLHPAGDARRRCSRRAPPAPRWWCSASRRAEPGGYGRLVARRRGRARGDRRGARRDAGASGRSGSATPA